MDLYKILGVDKKASNDEIKKAYHKKSKECHPDIHPDKAGEFEELNEAYNILMDEESRGEYDRGGFQAVTGKQNQLLKRVLAIFEEVINFHGFVPDHSDLFSMMQSNINEKDIKMNRDIETYNNEIKNIKSIQGRIKNADMLVSYLDNHIDDYTDRIRLINREIEYLKEALEFIKDFKYDFDEDTDWDAPRLEYADGGIDGEL